MSKKKKSSTKKTYDRILLENKIKNLIESGEDVCTALMELAPESSFAATVIGSWETVRDDALLVVNEPRKIRDNI